MTARWLPARAAFDWHEGVRAACACTLMLVLGWTLGIPDFSWAAIGAFWTGLAVVPGPVRRRLAAMGAFALCSTAGAALATWLAGRGLGAGTLAVLLVAGAAGLARRWGAQASQVGILAATAFVVAIERPVPVAAPYAFLVFHAGGCLGAALLAALYWQVAPPAAMAAPAPLPETGPPAHFAARLGSATALAYLAVHVLRLDFPYWATMTVLLVLQPSVSGTLPRNLERAIGTVLGTVVAMGVGLVARTPWAIALAVFPLVALTMALRAHSYRLFVLFLTPAFVLVADFGAPVAGPAYALARLEDNLVGCLIAFLAMLLLWPTGGPAGWAHERRGRSS